MAFPFAMYFLILLHGSRPSLLKDITPEEAIVPILRKAAIARTRKNKPSAR